MGQNFMGFNSEALTFLREIKQNNSKAWYLANKAEYQRLLLCPFQALVSDLSGAVLKIDPELVTTPAVDKTISRIYRDTRFSKDKSLYRDSMWLTFKRFDGAWQEAPAYFFEIFPEGYRYGMGFYNTPKKYMDRFRELLATQPEAFLQALAPLRQNRTFTVAGDRYRKVPALEAQPEVREWLKYKNFYFTSEHSEMDSLYTAELVGRLIAGFRELADVYQYLWEIKRQVDSTTYMGR
jgi:uncharacterized protein (TIGR02453 family)